MFLDACHDALRQIERGAACTAPCTRLAAGAYAVKELLQFGVEGLDRRRIQLFEHKFGLRPRLLDRHAQGVASSIVQRNVFVLLKESHLADALCRDAAGGDVCDGAARELQPRVRDVNFVGEHRNADRFYFGDRFFDERQQYVEIVNHQVVDHIDVETAWRKDAEAMNFEEQRAVEDWLDRDDRRIETFDVADLQDAREFFGGGEESVGFGHVARHRFFDEDVEAIFHQATTDRGVIDGRNGNAGGINLAA